jgi:hypothetical protein
MQYRVATSLYGHFKLGFNAACIHRPAGAALLCAPTQNTAAMGATSSPTLPSTAAVTALLARPEHRHKTHGQNGLSK